MPRGEAASAWDNRGGIAVGNDARIGLEAVILLGVTIGDGAIIGARAVVKKDVPPYTIVGGVPAKMIRRRFDDSMIAALEAIRWWGWEKACVRRAIPTIKAGDIFSAQKNVSAGGGGKSSAAFRWGRVRADYEHFIRNSRNLSVFSAKIKMLRFLTGY